MKLNQLYHVAKAHQQQHNCSAHPYEQYERLFGIVKEHQPKRILEIGTGVGFTALVMAQASPEAQIDSIEKDSEHAKFAEKFLIDCFASPRLRQEADGGGSLAMTHITIHNKVAEEFLPTLQEPYDLIFFDGYQIHQEFMPQYLRLLKSGGILVLGNNQLTSKTSDQFFGELAEPENWQILDRFADTTVARRI
jgi:predicted O-methyltransferase YrrM